MSEDIFNLYKVGELSDGMIDHMLDFGSVTASCTMVISEEEYKYLKNQRDKLVENSNEVLRDFLGDKQIIHLEKLKKQKDKLVKLNKLKRDSNEIR